MHPHAVVKATKVALAIPSQTLSDPNNGVEMAKVYVTMNMMAWEHQTIPTF
jgi:hypothetical protein